jgi:hypothetical protein
VYPLISYEEALKLHEELHEKNFFLGNSIKDHLNNIIELVDIYNVKTVCDYGCGKARCWIKMNLKETLDLDEVLLYDPCYEIYKNFPDKKVDMIICTDVMEHIPEDSVDYELKRIFDLTDGVIYFSISSVLAKKELKKGVNAHLTVKDQKWWYNKIQKHVKNHIVRGINYDPNKLEG